MVLVRVLPGEFKNQLYIRKKLNFFENLCFICLHSEYTCATSAAEKFPAALSVEYVDKYFNLEEKTKVGFHFSFKVVFRYTIAIHDNHV